MLSCLVWCPIRLVMLRRPPGVRPRPTSRGDCVLMTRAFPILKVQRSRIGEIRSSGATQTERGVSSLSKRPRGAVFAPLQRMTLSFIVLEDHCLAFSSQPEAHPARNGLVRLFAGAGTRTAKLQKFGSSEAESPAEL